MYSKDMNTTYMKCKSHQMMNTIRVKRGCTALGRRSELYPDLLLGATVFVIEQKDNNIFHVLSCERIIILPCSFLRFGFLAKELVAPFQNAQMDFGLRNQSMVGLLVVKTVLLFSIVRRIWFIHITASPWFGENSMVFMGTLSVYTCVHYQKENTARYIYICINAQFICPNKSLALIFAKPAHQVCIHMLEHLIYLHE
jgi:hypothetical protein